MKRYNIICLFAFCFCGCTQTMENKQSDGNAMSILMDNIFAKEEISLSAYYPLKDSDGKVWRADSVFGMDRMVFRFTQQDCEECVRSEINLIKKHKLSEYTVGIASYDNLRVLQMAIKKYGIDFPVFFLPFEQEKDVFPSESTIRRPFIFLMQKSLRPIYFFYPQMDYPEISTCYYEELTNRLNNRPMTGEDIFMDKIIDLGTVQIGNSYEAKFRYTNVTQDLLIINNVRTSCECTVPSWNKEPLRKGQTSELCILFRPESYGYNKKNIMVSTNKTKYPVLLTIKANVE